MIVDDGTALTLEQWLQLISSATDDDLVADYHFPTDVLKEEYIKDIQARSATEVIDLIRRFLVPSGYLGADKIHLARLSKAIREGAPVGRFEWERRAVEWMQAQGKAPPPWEGITWIIDLLPHWPGEALKALDAYFLAHAQLLPDGRFSGLADAAELIRAKFIGVPGSTEDRLRILKELTPRGLECIVERLYHKLGYITILTRSSKDGGRDVIAKRTERTRAEELKIQVKRYEVNVGVSALRELLGVVSAEKSNKGVLITTSDFSRPAKAFAEANPRLELISGVELVLLLNEHDGSWVGHLDRLLMESEQHSMRNNPEVDE